MWIWRMASTPSICGISRSIKATSGDRVTTCRTISSPVPASAITSKSGCVPSMATNPSRTTGWSSATTIRIDISGHPQGNAGDDNGSFAWRARQLDLSTQQPCPLVQADQPEARLRDCLRVEADAIVFDTQLNLLRGRRKAHHQSAGVGVPDHVGNGLLRNTKQPCLYS